MSKPEPVQRNASAVLVLLRGWGGRGNYWVSQGPRAGNRKRKMVLSVEDIFFSFLWMLKKIKPVACCVLHIYPPSLLHRDRII